MDMMYGTDICGYHTYNRNNRIEKGMVQVTQTAAKRRHYFFLGVIDNTIVIYKQERPLGQQKTPPANKLPL